MTAKLKILLADDDKDDCIFFQHAVNEMQDAPALTIVNDGEQLMHVLVDESTILPDLLFLDLNMQRKNGFECLIEIKQSLRLRNLPVIIFSTSMEQEVVSSLYNNGAQHFIRKPVEFSQFKKILHQTIKSHAAMNDIAQPPRSQFIITLKS